MILKREYGTGRTQSRLICGEVSIATVDFRREGLNQAAPPRSLLSLIMAFLGFHSKVTRGHLLVAGLLRCCPFAKLHIQYRPDQGHELATLYLYAAAAGPRREHQKDGTHVCAYTVREYKRIGQALFIRLRVKLNSR